MKCALIAFSYKLAVVAWQLTGETVSQVEKSCLNHAFLLSSMAVSKATPHTQHHGILDLMT